VRVSEILFVYSLEFLVIAFILAVEIVIAVEYILNIDIDGYRWIVAFFIIEISQVGFLFGFFISVLVDKVNLSGSIIFMLHVACVLATGASW
jgi:hypothetical protein